MVRVDCKNAQQAAGAIFAQTLVIVSVSLFLQAQKAAQPIPPLGADAIVGKLIAANLRRARELRGYTAKRSYHVDYRGFPGSREAAMQVDSSYAAPDKKEFKIVSQSGSKFLINHIFQKLLDSEQVYLQKDVQEQSELSPRNYGFSLAGTDTDADGQYYVLEVTPKRKTQFLYRGKIWVDAHDFVLRQIQGATAKNPSMWIKGLNLTITYGQVNGIWVQTSTRAVAEVRFVGTHVLTSRELDVQPALLDAQARAQWQARQRRNNRRLEADTAAWMAR